MVDGGVDVGEHFFRGSTSRWGSGTQAEVWTPPEKVEHHHPNDDCGCEPTVVYIRVSKVGERDPDSIKSPDIQLDECRRDCERNNKRIVVVISDIDKSGRTFRKRSVDKVIALVKRGTVKSVTVWKWSRWGRNTTQSSLYENKLSSAGGRLDSATEPFDRSTAVGRLTRRNVQGYDEYQSDLIGEGWQAAQGRRRKDGLPHSGRARFGYRYLTKDMIRSGETHGAWTNPDGTIVPGSEGCELCQRKQAHFWPDSETGSELAKLYESYVAETTSVRAIALTLNELDFRTAFGGRWTQQAAGQMMDTGFAAGLIRERSRELLTQIKAREEIAEKKLVRNSLKTFDVWRKGAQPALISKDLWEKYKTRRLELCDVPPRSRVPVHALSRLLFCEICSRRLSTRYAGKHRQHQWTCPSRQSYHPDTPVSISNAAALDVIRKWVKKNLDPSTSSRSVDEIAKAAYGATKSTVRPPGQIQNEINAATKAHGKLILMNASEKITDDEFDAAKDEFDILIVELKKELAQAVNVHGVTGKPTYEAFESLDTVWDETLRDRPVGLNAPLRELISFVIVSPALGKSSRWNDPAGRVEVVSSWDRETKDTWLNSRRRRFSA